MNNLGEVVVVQECNLDQNRDLIKQFEKLRADKFFKDVGEEGLFEGREFDWFDLEHEPAYVFHVDPAKLYLFFSYRKRRLIGGSRLIPMTRYTLAEWVFSSTFPNLEQYQNGKFWECSRTCFDAKLLGKLLRVHGGDERTHLCVAANLHFATLGQYGLKWGIKAYVANFTAAMHRLYKKVGCEVEIVGSSKEFGPTVFGGLIPVRRDILTRVEARLADLLPHSQAESELA